ncbi:MAG: hypothetical protein JNJ89_09290 [Rubrivivax sp.]|nr:hypothetical protein [Rubrivivax sp.]
MNPLSFIGSPIKTLWHAFAMPFKAIFVVGLCFFINQFTSPAHAWWHWVALGMGIAVLVAWARALKTIVLLLVVFYVGRWIYRRYGEAAKARFDQWVGTRGTAPAGSAGESAPAGSAGASAPRPAGDVLRLVGNEPAMRSAGIVH